MQTSSSLTALVKLQPRTALLLPAADDGNRRNPMASVVAKKTGSNEGVKEIDASLVKVSPFMYRTTNGIGLCIMGVG